MIEGTEISGFREYGIIFRWVRNFTIDRVYVHHCVYEGIAGASCEDGVVNAPQVYDIGPGSPADAYGMFFDRLESGLNETTDPRSYRIKIVSPDIQRVTSTGGNAEGIDSHGGVDISVLGGTIVDCYKGVAFVSSSIGGAAALAPIRCKVIGTAIKGDHRLPGIVVSGAIVGSTIVQHAESCVVSDVTVEGHGTNNVGGTTGGIVLQATKNTTVIGCVLRNNATHGIYLNFANLGINVSSNTIIDPNDTGYSAPSCIFVQGNDNRGGVSPSHTELTVSH